jgi:hypothetical protein
MFYDGFSGFGSAGVTLFAHFPHDNSRTAAGPARHISDPSRRAPCGGEEPCQPRRQARESILGSQRANVEVPIAG